MSTTALPTVPAEALPWLTTEQMVEVDRVMINDLGIELIQMMENAGRNLARLAIDRFAPNSATVYCGGGGNGGGGLVAARHLLVSGVEVEVVLSSEQDRFGPIPKHQLDIIERLGVPVVTDASNNSDLRLDAIIGYSLQGAPRGRAGELIQSIQQSNIPVLALDTPSGLDTATGIAHEPHITADATITLAAPKIGLKGQPSVGELYLADISVPPKVYVDLGFDVHPSFKPGPILRVS